MSEPSTPSPLHLPRLQANSTIPSTPNLDRIGFGCGVGVFCMNRMGRRNSPKSPWAVKKINRNMRLRKKMEVRLVKEAEILRSINHPNIVGFRELCLTPGGHQALAMEKCELCLGDLIEEKAENGEPFFDAPTISKVICSVSRALDYLHNEQEILHGDIKSYNVLIKGDFDEIKLCDFGVSLKLVNGVATGEYVGTPCWSPPESDIGPITAKSDIFPLGLVIWEMIALRPPHSPSPDDTISEEIDESELWGTKPDLTQDLNFSYMVVRKVFDWCCELDPNDRPSPQDLICLLQ